MEIILFCKVRKTNSNKKGDKVKFRRNSMTLRTKPNFKKRTNPDTLLPSSGHNENYNRFVSHDPSLPNNKNTYTEQISTSANKYTTY